MNGLLPFYEFSLWKEPNIINREISEKCKENDELFNESIEKYKNTNVTIEESTKNLFESPALEFSRKVSSTDFNQLSLGSTSDKVMYRITENDKLEPSRNPVSSSIEKSSCYNNFSYVNSSMAQPQFSHVLTSYNNAAQSTKNKRTSLLRGLFQRYSLKQRTSILNHSIKSFPLGNKQRCISGGDQVKISLKKDINLKEAPEVNYPYVMYSQGDVRTNQEDTNNKIQLSSQGLHYEFKDLKSKTAITPSEIQPTAYDPCISIPFANCSSCINEKSLLSLSDRTSIQQHTNEHKEVIQSAHTIRGIPKLKPTNSTLEKISLNTNQYKFDVQTPNYHYPKRLSTIKTLAKQYSLPVATRNSRIGLLWYDASQQKTKRIAHVLKTNHTTKKTSRSDSSSHSQDTSSSSCSSLTSKSSETLTNSTSSNSSSSSTSSTSRLSHSRSDQLTMKHTGQFSRNQNDQDELIQIDLNSISSQTSTNTSLQYSNRRQSTSRKKQQSSSISSSSSISNSSTTSDNDTSTSTS